MILPKVVIIVGPTASGKTDLAINLAKKNRGEIVSADSRQIYRGMDIGTAKPKKDFGFKVKDPKVYFSAGIPHHLVDIKNPNQDYTLAQYKRDALKAIRQILQKRKLPFLVGGTGLYASAIVHNLAIPEVKPNKGLRRRLERQLQKYGLAYLYGKLTALDPESAYIVDPKNPRRVIRALEIIWTSKKPLSQMRGRDKPLFACLVLGIEIPPKRLKSRINQRVERMIKTGLVREVRALTRKYGFRGLPFDAIGYREIMQFLQKRITLDEAVSLIKKNTWRFARRQYNWFKKLPVVWIKNQKQAETKIRKFLA